MLSARLLTLTVYRPAGGFAYVNSTGARTWGRADYGPGRSTK